MCFFNIEYSIQTSTTINVLWRFSTSQSTLLEQEDRPCPYCRLEEMLERKAHGTKQLSSFLVHNDHIELVEHAPPSHPTLLHITPNVAGCRSDLIHKLCRAPLKQTHERTTASRFPPYISNRTAASCLGVPWAGSQLELCITWRVRSLLRLSSDQLSPNQPMLSRTSTTRP